jgi:hypothetical protein
MRYIILTLILLVGSPAVASETVDVERLATAIWHAEGGQHTSHPYGILAHYKHTTPRQACINTIKHQYKEYVRKGRHGPFIAFLGNVYCPVGALNDPRGLNANWVKNVTYFYNVVK